MKTLSKLVSSLSRSPEQSDSLSPDHEKLLETANQMSKIATAVLGFKEAQFVEHVLNPLMARFPSYNEGLGKFNIEKLIADKLVFAVRFMENDGRSSEGVLESQLCLFLQGEDGESVEMVGLNLIGDGTGFSFKHRVYNQNGDVLNDDAARLERVMFKSETSHDVNLIEDVDADFATCVISRNWGDLHSTRLEITPTLALESVVVEVMEVQDGYLQQGFQGMLPIEALLLQGIGFPQYSSVSLLKSDVDN